MFRADDALSRRRCKARRTLAPCQGAGCPPDIPGHAVGAPRAGICGAFSPEAREASSDKDKDFAPAGVTEARRFPKRFHGTRQFVSGAALSLYGTWATPSTFNLPDGNGYVRHIHTL